MHLKHGWFEYSVTLVAALLATALTAPLATALTAPRELPRAAPIPQA